jgi:hypothetical protein
VRGVPGHALFGRPVLVYCKQFSDAGRSGEGTARRRQTDMPARSSPTCRLTRSEGASDASGEGR